MTTIVWAFKFEVVDVTLSNFSGVADACGLTNAAISNEPAIGETGDEELEEAMGFGSCYPIRTRGLNYVGSPLGRARLTLHDGANRPKPNGFARCWAVDEDGTMLDNATAVGHLVKATAEFPWDEDVASDCEKYWTYNDDDPDTSKCMWFVRGNEFLLDTSIDAARRGLRWGMDDCAWPSRGEWDGSGSAVCARTDFVTLHWTIPPLAISGSEVVWAPVMWSTVREVSIGTNLYDGSDATQSMYIPSHGGGQPFAATLENEKVFKLDFTGDPTESRFWDVGDYEFTLVDAHKGTPPLHAEHGEWAVVVVVKFLPPCKLLWYHGPLGVGAVGDEAQAPCLSLSGTTGRRRRRGTSCPGATRRGARSTRRAGCTRCRPRSRPSAAASATSTPSRRSRASS